MTTIAYTKGFMACDSCWAAADVQTTSLIKITRLPSGALLGTAGDADDRTLQELLKNVKSVNKLPSRDALAALRCEMDAIFVLKSGQVFKIGIERDGRHSSDFDAQIWPANRGVAAAGSGAELAIGAMAYGASAKEAVAIACNWDLNSRGPVHVVRLQCK